MSVFYLNNIKITTESRKIKIYVLLQLYKVNNFNNIFAVNIHLNCDNTDITPSYHETLYTSINTFTIFSLVLTGRIMAYAHLHFQPKMNEIKTDD